MDQDERTKEDSQPTLKTTVGLLLKSGKAEPEGFYIIKKPRAVSERALADEHNNSL